MSDDISQLISGIKKSYKKTNIHDVKLDEAIEMSPGTRVGYLLQHMENESNKEYKINFDPVESLFLDKLVSQRLIDKRIIITKEDFFRGIVFLDYLTNIIANDLGIIDEFYDIAKELEARDRNLDPDLELIVKYAGVHYVSSMGKNIIRGKQIRTGQARRRYNSKNKSYEDQYMILRKVSPVYRALGEMVVALVKNEEIKKQMGEMNKLYDIKAAMFVDTALGYISQEDTQMQILDQIKKDPYKASMMAIASLGKEVTSNSLSDYISSMVGNNGR
ncbi:hypothetical protein KY317_03705 [Candidatus Woesearchaeota archaeon]|nr:hypothetical protein [Candidatus Woesearchaeota archaeon]